MSNHAYEVALYGEFFAKDLRAILNRITLHSESSHPMHTREVVFEPMHAGRDLPSEQGILRARKELLHISGEKEGWVLYSFLKPESVRAHPEATVRPWATCHVVGDALSFASALGYNRRSQIYKRGYSFKKGSLVIQMFQQEQMDPRTQQPIPAHTDTLWEVEVKTAYPVVGSAHSAPQNNASAPRPQGVTPLTLPQAISAVLEVQVLMKGLLDLRRQDV